MGEWYEEYLTARFHRYGRVGDHHGLPITRALYKAYKRHQAEAQARWDAMLARFAAPLMRSVFPKFMPPLVSIIPMTRSAEIFYMEFGKT